MEVRKNFLNPSAELTKRFMDLVIAVIFGILLLPLVLFIALLIRIDSPGPIFYEHERAGRNKKIFKMVKFRTMVHNADQILGAMIIENDELRSEWAKEHKLKNDPRITRVGRILRRFSIDELPQIWNVLIGEMSLVGPRPIPLNEIELRSECLEFYYQVRPGITGLWQTSGRNELTYKMRNYYDEYYVCHWTLRQDFLLMVKTIPVVIKGRGAY